MLESILTIDPGDVVDAEAVQTSLSYLTSQAARDSLERDPYWPKWDSPWWHITLLWEVGHLSDIPHRVLANWARIVDERCLHFFPFTEAELPPGRSMSRDVMCHCGLGTVYRILLAAGLADRLEWARDWFVRYQMADGGWNCDEKAYTSATPHSSVESSLPILESLLAMPSRTAAEEACLRRGVRYLLDRRLCRSLSKQGALIKESWLVPTFPRFYAYDVLRGLEFLSLWNAYSGDKDVPADVLDAIEATSDAGFLILKRSFALDAKTYGPNWERGFPATRFPLLDSVSRLGERNLPLTAAWHRTVQRLKGSLGP